MNRGLAAAAATGLADRWGATSDPATTSDPAVPAGGLLRHRLAGGGTAIGGVRSEMDVEPMSGGVLEPDPRTTPVAESLSHREWDELVDVVVERIERKVMDELDRRGRRFLPEVF
jgi:hypothetical protein